MLIKVREVATYGGRTHMPGSWLSPGSAGPEGRAGHGGATSEKEREGTSPKAQLLCSGPTGRLQGPEQGGGGSDRAHGQGRGTVAGPGQEAKGKLLQSFPSWE